MLIGGNKAQVVANMRAAAERGDLNCKVEVDDPALTREEQEAVTQQFLDNYKTFYERAYGKKLTYDFDESDIAGWIPQAPKGE
ncbi:MAG: hypothetical protein LUE61_09650 [Clostridiales bacterium]|nr:hypothetical protein [Clostridiales bacterium]